MDCPCPCVVAPALSLRGWLLDRGLEQVLSYTGRLSLAHKMSFRAFLQSHTWANPATQGYPCDQVHFCLIPAGTSPIIIQPVTLKLSGVNYALISASNCAKLSKLLTPVLFCAICPEGACRDHS